MIMHITGSPAKAMTGLDFGERISLIRPMTPDSSGI
jgi:hypothetical protein